MGISSRHWGPINSLDVASWGVGFRTDFGLKCDCRAEEVEELEESCRLTAMMCGKMRKGKERLMIHGIHDALKQGFQWLIMMFLCNELSKSSDVASESMNEAGSCPFIKDSHGSSNEVDILDIDALPDGIESIELATRSGLRLHTTGEHLGKSI